MARRALTPSCLTLVQCLEAVVPQAMSATGIQRCRIGLSGGADSLALTAAFAWARDRRPTSPLVGVEVSARVVDHGLQSGSDAVAAQAVRQAESLGVDAEVVAVEVDFTGIGVEAAARAARYAALLDGPEALILLAHTLDDQAETVLLGLARGSGTRSLAGMAPLRGRLVRPFLSVHRTDTEQACRDWNLTWWTDPTNDDPTYTRSRLRGAMGLLEQTLGPSLRENLARTADLCRADADLLDQLARETGLVAGRVSDPLMTPEESVASTLAGESGSRGRATATGSGYLEGAASNHLEVRDLTALPDPIRHRVLLAWLREIGSDAVTREHVLAVDSLVTDWHGQKSITVPGGLVTRESAALYRRSITAREDGNRHR